MKKLVASYVEGMRDVTHGESFNRIMRYFIPEIITAFLLYSLPVLLDVYFIGHLKSTAAYGALSGTNTLFHFFTKIAEAISVGTLVAVGNHNGRSEYKDVGRVLRDSFLDHQYTRFGSFFIYFWCCSLDCNMAGAPRKGTCCCFIFTFALS